MPRLPNLAPILRRGCSDPPCRPRIVACGVLFEIVGEIRRTWTVAAGRGVRQTARLNRLYGHARRRKMKGEAVIRLPSGELREAELHWYEAHGVGKREMKLKRYLDQRDD